MGISYAAVCVVDNLANGVSEHELSIAEFEAGKRANQERLVAAVEAVSPALEAVEAA
jgi:purine nucleoside phosphorylase